MTEQDKPNRNKPDSSLGAQLKSARVRCNMTIEQVAAKTKIRPDNIEAIESDDTLEHIPHTYYRGYVACYAKTVGLRPEALLALITDVDHEAPRIAYSTGNSFQMKQNTHEMDTTLTKTKVMKRSRSRVVAFALFILVTGFMMATMWPLSFINAQNDSNQLNGEHKLDSIIGIT